MLRAGWGERKRERAGNDGPPRAFYCFDYCYFYRDTQREPLRRREAKKIVAGGEKRQQKIRLCPQAKKTGDNHAFFRGSSIEL